MVMKEDAMQYIMLYTLWHRGVGSGCGYLLAGLIVGFGRFIGFVDSKKNIQISPHVSFNTGKSDFFAV